MKINYSQITNLINFSSGTSTGITGIAKGVNDLAVIIIGVFTGIIILAILVLMVFTFVQNAGASPEKRRENQKKLLWAVGGIIMISIMWVVYGFVIANVDTAPTSSASSLLTTIYYEPLLPNLS